MQHFLANKNRLAEQSPDMELSIQQASRAIGIEMQTSSLEACLRDLKALEADVAHEFAAPFRQKVRDMALSIFDTMPASLRETTGPMEARRSSASRVATLLETFAMHFVVDRPKFYEYMQSVHGLMDLWATQRIGEAVEQLLDNLIAKDQLDENDLDMVAMTIGDFIAQCEDNQDEKYRHQEKATNLLDALVKGETGLATVEEAPRMTEALNNLLQCIPQANPRASLLINMLECWPSLDTKMKGWASLHNDIAERRNHDPQDRSLKAVLQSFAEASAIDITTSADFYKLPFQAFLNEAKSTIDEAKRIYINKVRDDMTNSRDSLTLWSKGTDFGDAWWGDSDPNTKTFLSLTNLAKDTLLKLDGKAMDIKMTNFSKDIDAWVGIHELFDAAWTDAEIAQKTSDLHLLAQSQATKYSAILLVLLNVKDPGALAQKQKRQIRSVQNELRSKSSVANLIPQPLLARLVDLMCAA